MNKHKIFFVFLLISFSLSVCTSGVVFAQSSTSSDSGSISTPSVPEFTVEFIDNSSAFQLWIKNEPFTPIRKDGHTCGYYYKLRVKNDYTDMSSPLAVSYITRSNAEYTVVTYVFGMDGIPNLAPGSKFDVQLHAIIGVMEQIPRAIGFVDVVYDTHVTGESSSWSDPVTVVRPFFSSTTDSLSSDSYEMSFPEFTVELVSHPYDVPTTYSIDQYTGANVTHMGYRVENQSIELRIKNQPFTPYVDEEGNEINLHFNVRFKKRFGSGWTELNTPEKLSFRDGWSYATKIQPQSSSEDTVYVYSSDYPDGAALEYQVRTLLGYYTEYYPYIGVGASSGWTFHGEFSDWSDSQTLIIPPDSPLLPESPSVEFEPFVPEFTMEYVDYSYDVPPTYGIDQFTGKRVITKSGYHVDNRTVEFTIKNQPFTSFFDSNGNEIDVYYNFRFKGRYGNTWYYYPNTSKTYGYYAGYFPDTSVSNSDYTSITVNLDDLPRYPDDAFDIPTGSELQFQIQTVIGYIQTTPAGVQLGAFCEFVGERSDWSDSQTITISSEPSTTSSTEPETTESNPEKSIITDLISDETPETTPLNATWTAIIILALIGVANIVLLICLIKRK